MDALVRTRQPTPLRERLLREPARPARIRESSRASAFVVGTVCIGAFMGQLDASIVTLALPRIGAGLGEAASAVRWVSLAYMLVLACTLVPVGLLADRFGRKLLYTYGFAVFTLGSVLCGLAPTLGWLIAARVLQGLGAAMLQANSVALIVESLPPGLLPRGLGVQGAAQAVGLALGPAIGGLLLALGGWPLIFFVNLPAGILGIALAWVLLPRSRTAAGALRRPTRGAAHDVARGGFQSAASGEGGGVSGNALRPAATRERFDRRALAVGLGGAMTAYAVMFGTLYTVSYHLAALHLPTALAGLELAALPVALGICAPLAGRLAEHVDARVLTLGGPLLAALGLGVLLVGAGAGLPIGLALVGGGLGAFVPLNNATVMRAAPRSRVGVLSGILNTTRCLGTALGVALPGVL
ncbi:MAG TPA: MFS transporter [Solirubrobacteraceae bacterium]|jgi:MFS family permease|nr:MFS transporter [Solirubrobacteraceae bacterium]